MSVTLEIAASQLGVKEISGSQNNQTIVSYARESGFDWVNDDETAWCSIFVSWVAMKCDLKRSKAANARSWLDVGMPVADPEPGDVVVFWREAPNSWKGHVGFFLGFSKNAQRVYCLGGNQGNQVSISGYRADAVLGFRRLHASKMIQLPEEVLKKGDTGEKVKQLQQALKMAHYQVGTTDGIFGVATEAAIKLLQANAQLEVDGVFGPLTANYLNTILNA